MPSLFDPNPSDVYAPIVPTDPAHEHDICRNRHGGDAESAAAHEHGKGQHAAQRLTILRMICEAGPVGMTLDELAQSLGVAPNRISGRITELKKLQRIKPSGLTRPTRLGTSAKVYVVF